MKGHSAAGRVTMDYGRTPQGRLMYDPGGRMSVHLLKPDRKSFASGDFLRPTPEELREAFDGYFGYYGRYTVDEKAGVVTHHVEGAAYPNYIGTISGGLSSWRGIGLFCKRLRSAPEVPMSPTRSCGNASPEFSLRGAVARLGFAE